MPSPTDAVCAALSQSLSSVPRKGLGSEGNGEVKDVLDSALIGANKLAEVTRHQVEYEPADIHQAGAQNVLKSKYIVLDTKALNGFPNGNSSVGCGHPHGTNQDLNTREFSATFSSNLSNNLHNGVRSGVSQNGLVNGVNSIPQKGISAITNGVSNGPKKPLSNGNLNGSNTKGIGNLKAAINPDSILPKPTQVLFDPDQVVLGWRPDHRSVGAGMYNLGNTCYLNSALQALFHVPAFVSWLLSDTEHMKKCEQENGSSFGDCIICSMGMTLRSSLTSHPYVKPYIKPYLIHNKLRMICRHFNHNSQEDAHEFMRHLLESMEKSYLKRYKHLQLDSYSKETTPINQIFGGYIRTEVKCRRCNYASTTFQHFQDLILDIRKASKVEEAMEQYFSNETLEGENSYRCEKCKTMVMAFKKFSIEKPPKVLCIQLKRFNVLGVKMQKTVEHRVHMDLSKFVHPKSEYAKQAALPYRLISMVSHMGQSSGSGHYTAVARCSSDMFYQFDDTQVKTLPLTSVLNHSAYILMYEMEPHSFKTAQKSATTTSVGITAAADGRNGFGNSTNKNLVQNLKGLPAVKDRDRVSFGLSPIPTSQPRIVFNTKKGDTLPVMPAVKSLPSNGLCNGETRSGGPQTVNGKHSGFGLANPKQLRDVFSPGTGKETCSKAPGPLVPYELDDDSSSRESSLSPPSTDEKEMLTVTATTPRDWQVTNSSGLQSPSIHSESSNNSGASATGAHWNVTEEQPAPQIPPPKKTKDDARDLKSYESCHLSDTELCCRTSKSAGKSHFRAKSVERGSNFSKDSSYSEKSMSDEKHRRRKRSFSSESDALSSSQCGGKHNEVSDLKCVQQKANFNSEKIVSDKDKTTEGKDSLWSGKSASNNRLQSPESSSSQGWDKSNDNYLTSRHRENSFSTVWNGDSRSDTLSDLKKMSHQGFGVDRVSSWSGERSQNSGRDSNRQDTRKRPMDEYEEELDRGRVKKIKQYHQKWRSQSFQNYQNRSWSWSNQNFRHNRQHPNSRHQGQKNYLMKPYGKSFRDHGDYINTNRFPRQNRY